MSEASIDLKKSKKQVSTNFVDTFSQYIRQLFTLNKKTQIGVVNIDGVIAKGNSKLKGMVCLSKLRDDLDKAFNLKNTPAVAININSPGGSPVQSEMIFLYIRRLSEQKNIPVFIFMEDCAASGGYYIACAGDEIYASENSIVGSIGVVSRGFGLHDVIKKLGVERRVYTQGDNKSILDPFMPAKDSDIDIIKTIQKDIHDNFKQVVLERRRKSINKVVDKEKMFSGLFWSGKQAKEIGLIDDIGDMYTVFDKKFGTDIKYIYFGPKKGVMQKILSSLSIDNFADALIESIEYRTILASLKNRFM